MVPSQKDGRRKAKAKCVVPVYICLPWHAFYGFKKHFIIFLLCGLLCFGRNKYIILYGVTYMLLLQVEKINLNVRLS